MQDLNDKITGGQLTAAEWNEVPSEIQNVIEQNGITLSGGDLNQLGKGIAGYVANGDFYTDSGIANAYSLSVIGSKQGPTAYTNGMRIRFLAANPNNTAATVNVNGLGIQTLASSIGGALVGGEIGTLIFNEAVYSTAAGHFRLDGSTDKNIDQTIASNWRWNDNLKINFGSSGGTNIGYDTVGNSFDLNIDATVDIRVLDAGSIKLQYDNSANNLQILNGTNLLISDNLRLQLGTGIDSSIGYETAVNALDINLNATADLRLLDNSALRLLYDNSVNQFELFGAGLTIPNNISLTGRLGGGGARSLVKVDGADTIILADNLQPVSLNNNGSLVVPNHAGGTFNLHRITSWAQCYASSAGALLDGNNVTSVSRFALGTYLVTLTTGVADQTYNAEATSVGATPTSISIAFSSSTVYVVHIKDGVSGLAVDRAFTFSISNMST